MTLTQITEKGIKDGEIINADINASAAIAKSKIETFVNNNANDRVITGSATANTLNAESGVQINSDGRMMVNGTYGAAMFNVTGETALGLDAKRQFLGINSHNDDMQIRATYYSGGAAGGAYPDIKFVTTDSERMRITAGGAIGINNSTPASGSNLDVSGKVKVNSIGIGTVPIDHQHIHIESANPRILIRSSGTNAAKLMFGDQSNNDAGVVEYAHSSNSMMFSTGTVERMRINSAGNVSIGSTGYGGGGAAPVLYLRSTSGRQVKIHSTSAGTCGIQLSNSTTGEGEDSGFQLAVLGTGDGYINNPAAKALRFSTNNTERLRITSDGKVGINEDSPTQQLVIKAPTDDNPGLALHRDSGGGDVASINWTSGSGTPQTAGRINYRGGSGGNDGMAFYVNSDMSSPAIWAALGKRIRLPGVPGVAGSNLANVSIESDGNLCTTTSIRAAKKNIAAMTDISWLFNLNPVTFNWRTKTEDKDGKIIWGEDTDGGTQYGLIAEEVKEVKNDFCYYDNDGNLSGVHYDRLIAPLLKAIQNLKAENTALTTRVAALEAA